MGVGIGIWVSGVVLVAFGAQDQPDEKFVLNC